MVSHHVVFVLQYGDTWLIQSIELACRNQVENLGKNTGGLYAKVFILSLKFYGVAGDIGREGTSIRKQFPDGIDILCIITSCLPPLCTNVSPAQHLAQLIHTCETGFTLSILIYLLFIKNA